MSYCRWSSDNFQSDVYCYEDVKGGYTTHVSTSRYVGVEALRNPIPDLANVTDENAAEFARSYSDYIKAIMELPLEPIGLPHDGRTYNDPTLEDFAARLRALRSAGYRVPEFVFQDIEEEIAEAKAKERAT